MHKDLLTLFQVALEKCELLRNKTLATDLEGRKKKDAPPIKNNIATDEALIRALTFKETSLHSKY